MILSNIMPKCSLRPMIGEEPDSMKDNINEANNKLQHQNVPFWPFWFKSGKERMNGIYDLLLLNENVLSSQKTPILLDLST